MPGLRVLLVEDDVRVREVLAAYLDVDGFEVVEAADGVEGLESTRTQAPDLIVTDIMMPRMDGLTMVRQLRADEALRHIPVLLISGHSDPPDEVDLEAGPLAYIPKPVTLGGFLSAIRRLLAKARA